MTEEIRENIQKVSQLLLEYKEALHQVYPNFEQTHWLKRLFYFGFPKDLKEKEIKLIKMMIENRLYFELLDFLHVYKNPFWFMTLSLTIFVSHKLWILGFILLLLFSLYLERIYKKKQNDEIMKVTTKMSDVKVLNLTKGNRRF